MKAAKKIKHENRAQRQDVRIRALNLPETKQNEGYLRKAVIISFYNNYEALRQIIKTTLLHNN